LCEFAGIPSSCGPRFYEPEKGVLYLNLGGGKFRDVTQTAQATDISGKGLGVASADFDGSGRQSLAIANDEMPGDLLQPTGKSGTSPRFRNIGPDSNTSHDADGNVHGGMGIDWGDYDNDQKLDLVVATFQHEPKNVYRNEGDIMFTDYAGRLGLTNKTAPMVAFGVKWFDADNDGWLDLIFANGHVQDNIADIDKSMTYPQDIQLFRNVNGTSFEDVGASAGASFQKKIVGRGLAVGDYDNDGKVDVLIVDAEGTPLLLHNETPDAGNWLTLKLVGKKSNRDGIGALVTVEADGKTLLRHCARDGSYLSASDNRVHFGVDKATTANVTVKWTNGKTTTLKNVAANRVTTVAEEAGDGVTQK
jgi:enediyne biosynthesis protein E4